MNSDVGYSDGTPLSRAPTTRNDAINSSALLAEAKLLGSSPDMLGGATQVETFGSGLESHEQAYWMTTATIGDRYRRIRRRARPLQESTQAPEDHFEKANIERIELLARQYVAKDRFSSEEQARLAIVTERVRQLLPAVTVAEFEALERGLEKSSEISALLTTLRAQLDLLSGKRG